MNFSVELSDFGPLVLFLGVNQGEDFTFGTIFWLKDGMGVDHDLGAVGSLHVESSSFVA